MNTAGKPIFPDQPTTFATRPWLAPARLGVILVTLLAFGIFAVSIPESIRQASSSTSAIQLGGGALGFAGQGFAVFRGALDVLTALAFLIVAILLMVRRSHDGYVLFVALALVLTGVNYSDAFQAYYVRAWPPQGATLVVGALLALAEIVQLAAFFTFPDGKFVPRWTRWLALAWIPFRLAGWMYWYMQPLETRSATRLYDLAIQFAVFGVGIAAQVYRYLRATGPVQRQQTKWIVFAMSIATLVLLIYVSTVDTIPLLREGPTRVGYVVTFTLLNHLALIVIPLAVAASVLRYRLWDIDFIINRSLVYGTLTILLVILFLGSALVVARVFETFSGGAKSALALVVSGVAFGVLFQPARQWLQNLVDHRLYHILINYQPARFPALLRTGSLSGKMLGEYTILDPIGRGGMAEVYRGRHATLGRIAAVKILLNVLAEDPDFRKRFEREAQLIGRLKHPHIVNLFDFGLQDGMYYMAMEYLQGRDLAQVIAEGGALPFDQVRWIVRDIADALDYAHGEGLIHRDIKPSNIMLEPITSPGKRTQRAVLMDFGIARLATSTTRLTDTGIVGTLDYVSPEQIKEDPDLDRRADIYSLGVMVYQMLTGRLPLTAANPGALVMAHLFEPPTDPRTYRRAIPQEWAAAVLRALAKDPRSRFAAAGEMAKMFQ